MSTFMKRRAFIGGSALAAGALLATGRLDAKAIQHSISGKTLGGFPRTYICESGQFGKDEMVGLGVLRVNQLSKLEDAVQEIRLNHNYLTRISYKSNDRFFVPFAEALINLAVSSGDLEFDFFPVRGQVPNKNQLSKQNASDFQVAKAKMECYTRCLSKLGISDEAVGVKFQTAFGPSSFYKDEFVKQTSCTYHPVDTRESIGIQICSFFTGYFLSSQNTAMKNPVKVAVMSSLESQLGQSLKPGLETKGFIFHRPL